MSSRTTRLLAECAAEAQNSENSSEANNQWAIDTLRRHGVQHKSKRSSPTPRAAEQYLSAKPVVSQFCGWRKTMRTLACRSSHRSIVREATDLVPFHPPAKAALPSLQSTKICNRAMLIALQAADLSDIIRLMVLAKHKWIVGGPW